MAGRGHSVTLIAPADSTIVAKCGHYGIEAVRLPIGRKNIKGLKSLRHWFAANHADVVNTHSSTDSWLTAFSCKAPIVRTRHISAPVSAYPWNRWLYGSSAQRVVTTGESLRLHLINTLKLKQEHVVSIPTGIDLQRFANAQKAQLGIPEGAFVFGIVATLRSWKGHQYLVDAFIKVIKEKPDCHLVIAGDGPQRPALEKRISSEEKRANIHLLGQREDVPEVLAAMDCFVLPSYANEGVPQAIMQAMAAGLPVISTRVGAIEEVVVEGKTGVFVRPKDPQALAAAMLEMSRSSEKRVSFGRMGRQVAEQKFSIDRMIDAMEQVFSSVR